MLALEKQREALQLVGECYCEIRSTQEFLHQASTAEPEELHNYADRMRVLASKCLTLDMEPDLMPFDLSEALSQFHGVLLALRQLRDATKEYRPGGGRTGWGTATWETYQKTRNEAILLGREVREVFDAWAWKRLAPGLHAQQAKGPAD
jgi:hypothetical protein